LLRVGENGKALIDLRKVENDDIDAFQVRSIKNSESLLERPTIVAFAATSPCTLNKKIIAFSCYLRRKSVQWHGIVEITLV